MNQFFKTFFACLLAIIVSGFAFLIMSFILFAGILYMVGTPRQKIMPNTVLQIDLAVPIVDKPIENLMEVFNPNSLSFKESRTLLETVTLINRAAEDPRIDGIYLRIPMSIPSSVSTLYEVRQALDTFKQSGKFIVSYADVYSQGGYYLASVGDKIYLNPQGGLEWRGMSMTQLFLKGTLDKLGIEPELIRHGKFKGAAEPLILDKMSPENRLQMESLLQSIWDFVVAEIAKSRELDADQLQMYASTLAIESPQDAVDLNLIDGLMYRDQLADELAKLTGLESIIKGAKIIGLTDYKHSGPGSVIGNPDSDNQIAVVYAEGDIVDGYIEGQSRHQQIVGNNLAETLRSVRKDSDVKAVVFRINSGGGSALASEIIWREIHLTSLQKPVIVSLGNVAASGGYYIAAGADYILTAPTTLTGSIGVFGLAFNVEKGAREKLGITADIIRTNQNADIMNIFRPMTDAERMYIQNQVDSVYTRFTSLVAEGRRMNIDLVDELAGGRVWSGEQAVGNKLADATGSLADAIEIALKRAGLEAEDFYVQTYPEAANASFLSILGSMGSSVKAKFMDESMTGSATLGKTVQEEARQLHELMKLQGTVQALMPYKLEIE